MSLAPSTYERLAADAEAARVRLMATPMPKLSLEPEKRRPVDPPDAPPWDQMVAWVQDNFELDYPNAAARVPTVFSCITRIADDIASLPIVFQQYSARERTWIDVEETHEAYHLWRDEPNSEQSGLELKRDIQAALDMVGGSYVYLDHGARGAGGGRLPDELWATPAHLMHPFAGPRRSIKEYQYEPTLERFPGDSMIPFRYWNPLVAPSPMSPVGMSPLSAARAAFMSRFRMGAWQDKFFESGGSASHLFSVKDPAAFKPEQLEKMEKNLNKKRGVKHAFEARVVSGVELLRAGMTVQEMQFLEIAQLTDKDVCQVYKVPPVIIGIKEGGGMSDAGATTDLLLYADGCLAPRARLLSAVITRRFCNRYLPGVRAVVDVSGLMALQKAALDQAAAVAKLTGNKPVLSQNEARQRIGEQESSAEGADDIAPTPVANPFAGPGDSGAAAPPKTGDPVKDAKAAADAEKNSRSGAAQRDRQPEERGPEGEAISARRSTAKFSRAPSLALLKRRVDRDLARYERKLAKATRARLDRQEETVIAALEKLDTSTVAAARSSASRRVLLAAFHDTRPLLSLSIWDDLVIDEPADLEAAQQLFDQLITERGEAAAAEIGEEVALDVNQARLRTLIHNRASRLISNTNATTRDRLTRAVAEAVGRDGNPEDGGLSATIAAVRDAFDSRRDNAESIARTETMWAYNKGAEIAWRETGVKFKSWITANDEAVRETHQLCEDAGVVPFDSAFPNGLQYPGDESGPAEEVINCRCVLQPEFDEDGGDGATSQVFLVGDRAIETSRNGHGKLAAELDDWVVKQ